MAEGDEQRWDARWREHGPVADDDPVPDILLRAERGLPTRGTVLDLACGDGRAAVWLARRGLAVTAVDVSPVALARASERAARAGVPLTTRVSDLSGWDPGEERWDVVLCLRYLDRDLWASIRRAVAPGGLAVVEVLAEPSEDAAPRRFPPTGGPGWRQSGSDGRSATGRFRFRALPGELLRAFVDWRVLASSAWPEDGVEGLVARRPGNPGAAGGSTRG